MSKYQRIFNIILYLCKVNPNRYSIVNTGGGILYFYDMKTLKFDGSHDCFKGVPWSMEISQKAAVIYGQGEYKDTWIRGRDDTN